MPTLLIWGEHDRVLPARHAYLAHACMPGSDLEVFEDAGHFPHQANPDRFVELLGEFIANTNPLRTSRATGGICCSQAG